MKRPIRAGAVRDPTVGSYLSLQAFSEGRRRGRYYPEPVASAVRLPEVCRQIYSETALTLYKENIFLIQELQCFRSLKKLNEAQRSAITALEASPDCLVEILLPKYEYDNGDTPYPSDSDFSDEEEKPPMRGLDCFGLQPGYSSLPVDFLPNFRKFIVTDLAARFAHYAFQFIAADPTKEQLKDWVMSHFSELTDSGVEVILEG